MVTEQRRQYKKEHYLKNREKYYAAARDRRKIKRQMIVEAKSKPCMDCGQSYPHFVMDFDHKDPLLKRFTIGEAYYSCSVETLRIEIEKCDVVCSNCHRLRTHGL